MVAHYFKSSDLCAYAHMEGRYYHLAVRLLYIATCSFIVASIDEVEPRSRLKLPNGKAFDVCDNFIVNDISGQNETVLAYGKLYLDFIGNSKRNPLDKFQNKWRLEVNRTRGPMIPECGSLTVFGDEKKNYDEVKRFCFPPQLNTNSCVVFSVGSNNKWDFEEYMFRASKCKIETFDCTVDGIVPVDIQNRTRFHKVCLSKLSGTISGKSSSRYLVYPKSWGCNQLQICLK